METFEIVATFSTEIEADLAQATLAAAGIDSYLKRDDAGGMLTPLLQKEGIRLLVDSARAAEARDVLGGTAESLPES